MANHFSLQILLIFTSIVFIAVADDPTKVTFAPSISPSSQNLTSLIASVLSSLGFEDLSAIATNSSLSATTPITIFAPTDSSLITCPSCSLPVLLREHTVQGLYPLRFLLSLSFGTKIQTLETNRCLGITSSRNAGSDSGKVFVNGVEITNPDLFNNGEVIVHGLSGFISHLAPLSCAVEQMVSLLFPQQSSTPASSTMRLMLKDSMQRLRITGYSVLALTLRAKYAEFLDLREMTVFALDDEAIFAGGHAYVSDLRFHVVPNRRLMGGELASLPAGTMLPTMDHGESLTITTAGGGGPLAPIRINYVRLKSLNLVYNSRIVVHGLTMRLPHVTHPTDERDLGDEKREERSVRETMFCGLDGPTRKPEWTAKIEDTL